MWTKFFSKTVGDVTIGVNKSSPNKDGLSEFSFKIGTLKDDRVTGEAYLAPNIKFEAPSVSADEKDTPLLSRTMVQAINELMHEAYDAINADMELTHMKKRHEDKKAEEERIALLSGKKASDPNANKGLNQIGKTAKKKAKMATSTAKAG